MAPVVKNPLVNTGDIRDAGSVPGSGRSPGGGQGHPLQYSYLENPRTEEPGGLQSTGPQRVRHNWSDLALAHDSEKAMAPRSCALAWKIPWMEQPSGLRSMGSLRVGHNWATSLSRTGEGNGTPLWCSCLENPRDGGAWWAAVYGVAQSRTRLKWLSSSTWLQLKKTKQGWFGSKEKVEGFLEAENDKGILHGNVIKLKASSDLDACRPWNQVHWLSCAAAVGTDCLRLRAGAGSQGGLSCKGDGQKLAGQATDSSWLVGNAYSGSL